MRKRRRATKSNENKILQLQKALNNTRNTTTAQTSQSDSNEENNKRKRTKLGKSPSEEIYDSETDYAPMEGETNLDDDVNANGEIVCEDNDDSEGSYSIHPAIPTGNKFNPLLNNPAVPSTSGTPRTVNRGPQPPPIFIYHNDTKVITKIVKDNSKEKFALRAGLDYFQVKFNDMTDYRNVILKLKEAKVEHFTYNATNERPVKYLAKYIPTDIDITDIQAHLKDENIPVHSVTFLTKRTTNGNSIQKNKIPLVLINAPRSSAEKIINLNQICNINVKIERYNNQSIGQCYRCQEFGHSSEQCSRVPRCIRCTESHLTKECQHKHSTTKPPQCVNCNLPHTANYRGCNAYKIAKLRRDIATEKRETRDNPTKTMQDNTDTRQYRHDSRQFPALPSRKPAWQKPQTDSDTDDEDSDKDSTQNTRQSQATKNSPSLGDSIREIKELFTSFNLKKVLTILKKTCDKIKNSDSAIDKFIILTEAVTQIFN